MPEPAPEPERLMPERLMPERLMVVFSIGGLALSGPGHPRGTRGVRCRTGLVPASGAPSVVLDPFPGPGATGIVEGGRARIERDGSVVASREVGDEPVRGPGAGRRWEDVDLLAFAGTNLWTWIGLPLALGHPDLIIIPRAGARLEVTVPVGWPATSRYHVLQLDDEGRVCRHEEGGLVHHLSGHCDFGGAVVATRRRTRLRDRVTVLWADVVAAHLIPAMPAKPVN